MHQLPQPDASSGTALFRVGLPYAKIRDGSTEGLVSLEIIYHKMPNLSEYGLVRPAIRNSGGMQSSAYTTEHARMNGS